MKRIINILLIFFFINIPLLADEIHLMDGRVIKGKIIRVTSDSVEYDPEGQNPFDIMPRGQIFKIVYDSGKVVVLKENSVPKKIEDKSTKRAKPDSAEEESYNNTWIIGGTFGTPSGLNLLVGYHFTDFGFHLSGGYLGSDLYGVEGNIIYFFYQDDSIKHGISLLGGHAYIEDLDNGDYLRASYAGPSYNLFWNWFYGQVGLDYREVEEREGNTLTKTTGIGYHFAVGAFCNF